MREIFLMNGDARQLGPGANGDLLVFTRTAGTPVAKDGSDTIRDAFIAERLTDDRCSPAASRHREPAPAQGQAARWQRSTVTAEIGRKRKRRSRVRTAADQDIDGVLGAVVDEAQ